MDSIPADLQPFFYYALDRYWHRHRIKEPARYQSFGESMKRLRDATGLTQQNIASRLGIHVQRLKYAETTNRGVEPDQFLVLISIAKSYHMPNLADFLDTCHTNSLNRKKGGPKRGIGGEDVPEWFKDRG